MKAANICTRKIIKKLKGLLSDIGGKGLLEIMIDEASKGY